MIPANYTYETFADYIKDEVLLDTADELGWLDNFLTIAAHVGTEFESAEVLDGYFTGWNEYSDEPLVRYYGEGRAVWNDGDDGTLNLVEPSKYDIPTGTKIIENTLPLVLSTTPVHTVTSDVDKGDTVINVTSTGTPSGGNGIAGWFYIGAPDTSDAPVPITHPIYFTIADIVLQLMGKTTIESVTSLADKRKLRLLGRREAWRLAMQSLASDYNYTSGIGGLDRYGVYQHCQEMFDHEAQRTTDLYSSTAFQGDLITSQPARIKVRW